MPVMFHGSCSCGETFVTKWVGKFMTWKLRHIAKGHIVSEHSARDYSEGRK